MGCVCSCVDFLSIPQNKTMSINKYSFEEQREIVQTIRNHIYTLGIMDFFYKIRRFKTNYFIASGLTMLFFVIWLKIPFIYIFLPLVPYAILLLFYFIDLNVVVRSLGKAHTELIERGIKIDWGTLLLFVHEIFLSDNEEK